MPHILNVAPLSFENTTIVAETLEYSDEKFEQYRDLLRGTHLVKRRGSEILIIPLEKDAELVGGTLISLNLVDNLSIVRSLANQAVYRALCERKGAWVSSIIPSALYEY